MTTPVAAIDCGTNSTRLLVAGSDGTSLERLMRITRLGQGVDRTGALDPAAIERTVAVLGEYRHVMERHGVTRLRITATSAARDAGNRETFFARAAEVVGARPELLGGEEEGRLSFAGATADLDPAGGPYLVADIGGGSTELAVGPPPRESLGAPVAVRSLDIGCVRVTERFFLHDPPTAGELDAARAFVDERLDGALAEQPVFAGARLLVGLAGTVSALAGIEQGLAVYDRERIHHHLLAASSVGALLAALAGETAAARRCRPGLEPGRADVIVGGALILDRLCTRLSLTRCLVSEADILDGLAQTMLA